MIGIRMVVISVSGLRLSLRRSRRMIARVFMVSSARLRHSRADQEADLLGGFIAERSPRETDKYIFQRQPVHAYRGDARARRLYPIYYFGDHVRAVVRTQRQ